MSFPRPEPGLVIRYTYLWSHERAQGREEGGKDRPCAIVLAATRPEGREVVTVLPVTHTAPSNPALAMEIPQAVKAHLGMDAGRSWVVLTEANRFTWPGPDLRVSPGGDASSVAFGFLPPRFFRTLRTRFAAAYAVKKSRVIPRTE